MSATKTITLPVEVWKKVGEIVENYEDQGSQHGHSWSSEEWELMQARFKIALHDAKETPEPGQ